MKTLLALIVVATSVFVFTQAADAQCGCQQTVSYYAPISTTAYDYAPTTAYYAPTTAYYPTSAYYAPTTAYYGGGGYYDGGYYDGYNRGGLFGTGVGGWAGLRGINRRWDRRGW
ncbi:MAG: hypothetical protein ACLP9L_06975 [Thermoguttaceae bacterium]